MGGERKSFALLSQVYISSVLESKSLDKSGNLHRIFHENAFRLEVPLELRRDLDIFGWMTVGASPIEGGQKGLLSDTVHLKRLR